MMKIILWVILLFNFLIVKSQKTVTISFWTIFNNQAFILNDTVYSIDERSTIKFETLKFYISSIELVNNTKSVYKEKQSFHLIDASQIKSQVITLSIPKNITYTGIKFNLGIDSLTHTIGVIGGDLDPTKGMYWTWQSGYINFKLEGIFTNSKLNNKHNFQYHIGGFQFPYNTMQQINLTVVDKKNIEIELDIQKLCLEIDLNTRKNIMSPSAEALKLAQYIAHCFNIKK